jgi:hypothetical protein
MTKSRDLERAKEIDRSDRKGDYVLMDREDRRDLILRYTLLGKMKNEIYAHNSCGEEKIQANDSRDNDPSGIPRLYFAGSERRDSHIVGRDRAPLSLSPDGARRRGAEMPFDIRIVHFPFHSPDKFQVPPRCLHIYRINTHSFPEQNCRTLR